MNNLFSHTPQKLVAALFIGCFFLSGCENDIREIKELNERRILKDEATQVVSFLSQGGKLKAKLTAPLMRRVATDTLYVEFPQTMHIDFFNDSTKLDSRLDCLYGKYFENLGKAYLRDSVTVITVQGDTLRSPDLWWDQNRRIFYTDKYAVYHGISRNIYGGKGLVATEDLSSITFNQASGFFQTTQNGLPK
jgi:hypothetical protein